MVKGLRKATKQILQKIGRAWQLYPVSVDRNAPGRFVTCGQSRTGEEQPTVTYCVYTAGCPR